jgi:hypothetical protein
MRTVQLASCLGPCNQCMNEWFDLFLCTVSGGVSVASSYGCQQQNVTAEYATADCELEPHLATSASRSKAGGH